MISRKFVLNAGVTVALMVTACGGTTTPTRTPGAPGSPGGSAPASLGGSAPATVGGGATATAGSSAPVGGDLLVWTVEDNTVRVEAQRAIMDRFTQETGIAVELVPLAEGDFSTQLTAAAAGDTLPDVFATLSLGFTHQLASDGFANTEATTATVDALGRDTFNDAALNLVTGSDGALIGVPSDSFVLFVTYRNDLFDAASLEAPTTFASMLAGATELNAGSVAGIVLATGNDLVFVQQTFEHFAVANGCELVDDAGTIVIDSPACVETFQFYTDLVNIGSVTGAQDADTTRATYFSGDAAMIGWSSFLLDELAGLRDDALPVCPECEEDPLFLAQNSGVVAAIQGPSGSEPAVGGEVVSYVISDTADTAASQRLIEYMMSDGYVDWLAIAPEGKFPTRPGTADSPTEYADAWATLDAGVDRKTPLGEVYDEATIQALVTSAESIKRWGFSQGQGALAGAVYAELPVPEALIQALDGSLSAEEAAQEAREAVEELQSALE